MVIDEKLTHCPLLSAIQGLRHGFTNKSLLKEEHEALDLRTATVKQVHGDRLAWASGFEKRAREADGIATFKAGLPIGVFSADCTPVLAVAVEEKTNQVYAALAVHAGWRGTALCIVEKTLTEFIGTCLQREASSRFVAAIGPCIGPQSFEVSQDVIDAFPGCETRGLARFLRLDAGGQRKYLFDLPGENLRQLKAAQLATGANFSAEVLGLCTLERVAEFPSYRRDREKAGRILSFLEFGG